MNGFGRKLRGFLRSHFSIMILVGAALGFACMSGHPLREVDEDFLASGAVVEVQIRETSPSPVSEFHGKEHYLTCISPDNNPNHITNCI